MSDELLRCPFCNDNAEFIQFAGLKVRHVNNGCRLSELVFTVGEWQIRRGTDPQAAMIAAQAAEIERLRDDSAAMRKEFENIMGGENWYRDGNDEMYWCGTTEIYDNARRFLRGGENE